MLQHRYESGFQKKSKIKVKYRKDYVESAKRDSTALVTIDVRFPSGKRTAMQATVPMDIGQDIEKRALRISDAMGEAIRLSLLEKENTK